MKKYHWLNKDSRTFLSRGYLKKGQSAEERIKEISDAAEKILKIEGFSAKFEDYMARGFYSLSTPVWTNFGNERGCPVSCFNSYIPDTMDGILHKGAEVGMMSKIGGGTSGYFGDVRHRGSLIKDGEGGESSGPVHFMEMYEKITSVVTQGANRRGAFAAYLPIDHPDIEEFLAIKTDGHPIQEMSFGVCITDEWMEGLKNKDKDKQKIWAKIIKKKFEKGYPYLFFTDTVNNAAPQVYKDKNRKIHSANLCVVGETIIDIMFDGDIRSIRISDLNFYLNGNELVLVKSYDISLGKEVFSKITAFAQTGESKDIMEIEDEIGNIIKCTPEHKIYTKNRGYIEAQHLKETDILNNSL